MGHVLGIDHKRYILKVIGRVIRRRGEIVEDRHYEARKKICEGCDHYGEVMPLPDIWFDGCTLCGCPCETKCRMKTIMRKETSIGSPLSVKEIITNSITGEHLRPEVVRCSNHKVNGSWKGDEWNPRIPKDLWSEADK